MDEKIINVNGELLSEKKAGLSIHNRAYKFGDGLFESIRIVRGKALFTEDHFARLSRGMKELHLKPGHSWTAEYFNEQINRVLGGTNVNRSGRLRFTVFRKGPGFYIPSSSEIGFTVEFDGGGSEDYMKTDNGMKVGIYRDIRLIYSRISPYKTNNCLPYILAGVDGKKRGFDDMILLNNYGNICEAVSSNIFLYINKVLYTPDLKDGCVAGIMRKKVIHLAKRLKLPVVETSVNQELMVEAEEVFLTNAISGIRWVSAFEKKRYYHRISDRLIDVLNDII